MSAFTVKQKNQPGGIAWLCEAMASSGVNLLMCATTHGESGVVAFIADDEAAAQRVLEGAGIGYQLQPALTVRLENRPGAGAATFRKLADVGINVELLLPVRISEELFYAVICVDDPTAAEDALRDQVVKELGAGHESVFGSPADGPWTLRRARQRTGDRHAVGDTVADTTKAATATRDSARQSLADYATVAATLSDCGLHSAHAKGSICVPAELRSWPAAIRRLRRSAHYLRAEEAATLLAGTGTSRPIRAA